MRVAIALAALLGLLHALSFGPWPAWWLQTLSLAGLIALWLRGGAALSGASYAHPSSAPAPTVANGGGRRWRTTLAVPAAFALTGFTAGLCWLYVSMHDHGGMPSVMAAAAVVLFAAYLSIFPVAAFAVCGALARRGLSRPATAIVFAAAWTLGELARGYLFTGFPWLAIGYAHVDSPLSGWAPLLGVYGVCGLAALMAWSIGLVLHEALGATQGRRGNGLRMLAASGLTVGLLLVVGALLSTVQWAQPEGEPISVRLLQGNVPQQLKFDALESRRAMRAYSTMAAQGETRSDTDLTVMPETAWTIPWQGTDPAIVAALFPPAAAARARPHHVAIGMPLGLARDAQARELSAEMILQGRIANSVLLLRGDRLSDLSNRYDKRHLVPFGEFIPWGFDWFVRMMRIPLGSFARGAAQQPPLQVAGQRVAFNICYEDLFGEELAWGVRSDGGNASIIANVSNIAWFGRSHALPQHLEIARMRSIELARPTIRATNTGMTVSIDATGKVRAALEPQVVGVLEDQVQGMRGDTPYARYANLPVLLIAVGVIALAALRGRVNAARA